MRARIDGESAARLDMGRRVDLFYPGDQIGNLAESSAICHGNAV